MGFVIQKMKNIKEEEKQNEAKGAEQNVRHPFTQKIHKTKNDEICPSNIVTIDGSMSLMLMLLAFRWDFYS